VIVVTGDGSQVTFPSAIEAKVSEGHLFLFDGHSSTRPVAVFTPESWTAAWKKEAVGQ
jgi:hypothetical protein